MPNIAKVVVRFPGPQGGAGAGGGVGGSFAPINSPGFTGTPTAPTPASNLNNTQLATTAMVQAVAATRAASSHAHPPADVTGLDAYIITLLSTRFVASTNMTVTYNSGAGTWSFASSGGGGGGAAFANSSELAALISDESGIGFFALTGSPAFSGAPTAPTAAPGTNTTQLATCAFTNAAVALAASALAPLHSPGLTGVPTTPTAAPGNNTTQVASTAFVTAAVAAGGGGGGGSYSIAYAANITPVIASGELLDVGTLTGAILINAPTGTPTNGRKLKIRLNQDAVGGRAITWNAIFRFSAELSAGDLTTAPNGENRIAFEYNSTSAKWEAVGLIRF